MRKGRGRKEKEGEGEKGMVKNKKERVREECL